MQELKKSTPKCYINSYHFSAQHKKLFAMFTVFQIIQSMSFNGLFDLPSLFFILTLIAFFVYRNGYKVEYGLSTFVLSYWIQMACTIKYIYMMVVKIQVIDEYMTDCCDSGAEGDEDDVASNGYVKWMRIIFGL